MKGSCLCGKVVYRLNEPIIGINYCHCRQCRKASGSAFGTSAGVPREGLEILAGHDQLSFYESTPGKRRYFCGGCGSPLYSDREGSPTVYVRLGTLDDDPKHRPDVHIHVASKAPWFHIGDDVLQLDEEEGLWF